MVTGLSDRAGFGARRNGDCARRDRRRTDVGARRWGRFGDRLGRRSSASASARGLRRGRHRGGYGGSGCRRRGTGGWRTSDKLEHRHILRPGSARSTNRGSRGGAARHEMPIGQDSLSISVSARSNRCTVAAWSWSPTSFSALPAQARASVPSMTMPSLKQASTVYQVMFDRSRVVLAAYRWNRSSVLASPSWPPKAWLNTLDPSGWRQVASSQPTSSRGSPIVLFSQSTLPTP